MIRLSVNINKIATLRNARGGNVPDLLKVALDCEKYGVHGITVHPRPDQRHIRYNDVYAIRKEIKTEFNIEGYPSEEFIRLVLDVKPEQVTLVPDPPHALTSSAGWNTKNNLIFLKEVIDKLKSFKIRTSIFVDTDLQNIEYAKKTGTDRIELYTEPYATQFETDKKKAILPFINASKFANQLELGINAGHDLNLNNLKYFCENISGLLEVSIGHALICDSIYLGLEKTISLYLISTLNK